MADTNGTFDFAARYAQISERVENQGRDIVDLRSNMNTGFRNMESQITSFMNETRQSLGSLTNTIAGAGKPQWQAIGVAITFAVIIGGMAYWPIRESTTDLKANVAALAIETNQSIRMLAERSVSRDELDWRAARGGEDRTRTDKAIEEIRSVMLPRAEWAERNLSRDHDIENLRDDAVRDVANLQRQLDLQRSDFQTFASSMGNGRDFITDMKSEIGRLRDQLAEIRARQYQRFNSASPPP